MAKLAAVITALLAPVFALHFGSSSTGIWDFFSSDETTKTILLDLRAPRVILAGISGIALASAGVISQGLFRNALASPSIIGVTSGASFAASFTFYFGAIAMHWLTLPLAAFSGAMISCLVIFLIAKSKPDWSLADLLLSGFALSTLFSAMTAFFLSMILSDYQKSTALMSWLMGGFSAKSWEHLSMLLVPVMVGLFIVQRVIGQLDIFSMGEEIATTLSVSTEQLKMHAIFAIALLVGGVTAIAGGIPFVGLVVPHITRELFGSMHKKLWFWSMINGWSLLIIADLCARTFRVPEEIEIGILTSMIGAPFFLFLLIRKRGQFT